MDLEQTAASGASSTRRSWLRGESTIASIGIAAAAILLFAMAALSWWTMRTQQQQVQAWQVDRLRSLGVMLAGNIEILLATDDLSAVRRTITEAARVEGLAICRVTLPGGQIVADAEPSKINLQKLPATWSGVQNAVDNSEQIGANFTASYALIIPNRGPATLEVAMSAAQLSGLSWETQAGIGAIGSVSLLSLLAVYRRLRARTRAISAIREAILALSRGESEHSTLCVNTGLGPEAPAWNALLDELQQLRKQVQLEQAKKTLASRRSVKSDLDAAFDALPQGLLLVDEHLKIRYANGAAAVFLLTKRDHLAGTDITRWIAQEEILASLRTISTGTMRRKTSIEVEHCGKEVKEAATVLRFTIRPVRREDYASAMIVIEDITQQRAAAASRNHFVAQTTHELRTPLTNIRLYVETAIEEGERDPVVRGKCLNVINQETRRLERIVGEMLSVAEIEAGSLKIKRDDVRLDQLFNELKVDFQQQAVEKSIKLKFSLPPKMPVIQADRDKLAVALHNLVGNALKYTPSGGEVTITLEDEPKQLIVNVTDTGIGISEEDQQRIFERFYRANDPRVEKITGTGLGLTLAREVLRLHGGEISVRSEINKGSTFTVTLPSHTEAA